MRHQEVNGNPRVRWKAPALSLPADDAADLSGARRPHSTLGRNDAYVRFPPKADLRSEYPLFPKLEMSSTGVSIPRRLNFGTNLLALLNLVSLSKAIAGAISWQTLIHQWKADPVSVKRRRGRARGVGVID